MKTSIVSRKGVSPDQVDLIVRLVALIPWPTRRRAMGDVTLSLLDGKTRVAENVFGWNRSTVHMGLHECRTGITCLNDLSNRRKPRLEEKYPRLLTDIREIMEPVSHADPHLRTTFAYTNMTAQAVYNALVEKGWSEATLPTVRTMSNILNRLEYRLRTVAKTQVQKKRQKPTPFSKTSGG